jgi:Zn-dependent protease with chaperone function
LNWKVIAPNPGIGVSHMGTTGRVSSRNNPVIWKSILSVCIIFSWLVVGGCALVGTEAPPSSGGSTGSKAETVRIDASQRDRLQRVIIPLLKGMNNPLPPSKVKIGVINSADINAGNAGGGQFLITLGLLRKANDEELRGVLAHEIAHEDLGHVMKTQALGTGLQLGSILLDQIIPGAGSVAPVIADLGIMKPFSRGEEYQADSHGVEILNRAGYNGKQVMDDTLTWLLQTSGPSGGFFQTHPGTEDRIQRIKQMK